MTILIINLYKLCFINIYNNLNIFIYIMRDKVIVNCRYFRTRKITNKDTLINIKMNILIYEKFNNINYKEMSFSLYKESQ